MEPSPLQLERHFFTKVHVDAHPEGDPSAVGQLRADVEVARATNDARRYQLTLRLKLLPSADKKPHYTADIHAVGFFRVIDAWPEAKVVPLVEANGAAILYGAAREMLCNLTARGPWPMLCLHSVTFVQPKPAPNRPEVSEAHPEAGLTGRGLPSKA